MVIPLTPLLLPSSVRGGVKDLFPPFSPMGIHFISAWSEKFNHHNFNLFPPHTFLTGTLPVIQPLGGEIL